MTHQLQFPPEKFGAHLGDAPGGVAIFSSHYPSVDQAEYPDRDAYRNFIDGVYMGYKWQCVEFARRWLYLNHGYVFDDVPMAHDIFRLHHVTRVADGELLPLHSFRNGGPRPPEPGCMLIWDDAGEFEVTGHVAIVTEVLDGRIRFAEQNVEHCKLPHGQQWSRELPLVRTPDEGWFVDASYPGARVLGWVVQTADGRHAERHEPAEPRLFALNSRLAPLHGRHLEPWLDPASRTEAAFIKAMGGHRLSEAEDIREQYRYFRISQTAADELRRATNELHLMFMHATQAVLQDDALLERFCIPRGLWPRLRDSWARRRGQSVTGRFDFALSERGLKVYEYNADSASCHMETGRVQGKWAEHFGVTDGVDAGAELTARLVEGWRDSGVEGLLHIMQDDDAEETYHAQYMRAAAEQAGLACKVIRGLAGLGWNAAGEVVDPDGVPIRHVWKTWAWETALDQIREQCEADDQLPELRSARDEHAEPRLVDVLLRPDVKVFEPFWTLIPSNKAILPVLWQIFGDHPDLLQATFELDDEFNGRGYVAKPIAGRCGANISLFDRHDNLLGGTEGRFKEQDQVYQELWKLPEVDGYRTQLCTFTVRGRYAGACTRADASLIITMDSDVLPLRIVEDDRLED
ncbi:MAG TPA: bifunctional glutathionylspermidine amidase/synthase [Xanthomonadales bacterium]|nr:bifunctional glutathionylspermidine amidase/synthase [Xanthomonadales bacterium]